MHSFQIGDIVTSIHKQNIQWKVTHVFDQTVWVRVIRNDGSLGDLFKGVNPNNLIVTRHSSDVKCGKNNEIRNG